MNLNEIARLLICAAYHAYSNAVYGNGLQKLHEYAQRVRHPRPGDMVFEATSWGRAYKMEGTPPIPEDSQFTRSVGELLEIKDEPYPKWDEADVPVPTRQVWYIKALDGEIMKWENCQFIVIPRDFFEVDPK